MKQVIKLKLVRQNNKWTSQVQCDVPLSGRLSLPELMMQKGSMFIKRLHCLFHGPSGQGNKII